MENLKEQKEELLKEIKDNRFNKRTIERSIFLSKKLIEIERKLRLEDNHKKEEIIKQQDSNLFLFLIKLLLNQNNNKCFLSLAFQQEEQTYELQRKI